MATEQQDEFLIRIDVPEVFETSYRIKVRCGEATCEVYEYGHQGSGHWCAWKGGNVIGERHGQSLDQALADARAYVVKEERSRLTFAEVRRVLAEVNSDD